jgi:hypothetical protein
LVAGDLRGFAKAKAESALVFTIPEQPSDLDDGLLQASGIAELTTHKRTWRGLVSMSALDPMRTTFEWFAR